MRPTDWSVFSTSWEVYGVDPVQGDPDGVKALVVHYRDAADAIKAVWSSVQGDWLSGSHADSIAALEVDLRELAGVVSKAESRYRGVADALAPFGVALGAAQSLSLSAYNSATQAKADSDRAQGDVWQCDTDISRLSANSREAWRQLRAAPDDPELLWWYQHWEALLGPRRNDRTQAIARRDAAESSLEAARVQLRQAIRDRDNAAIVANEALLALSQASGLRDGFIDYLSQVWDSIMSGVADLDRIVAAIINFLSGDWALTMKDMAGAPSNSIDDFVVRLMELMEVLETRPLSESDVLAINADIESQNWSDSAQHSIGDCYLLASIVALQQTAAGQQLLRDNVRWDVGESAYVVTLYEMGVPVEIVVRDLYTNGVDIKPSGKLASPGLISVYERAYGQLVGGVRLHTGAPARDALEAITGHRFDRVDSDPTGWGWLPWVDDNPAYDPSEWNSISDALKDGKPVVASTTSRADFSHGDSAEVFDRDGNRMGTMTIMKSHAYTVLDITDDHVKIRNPWNWNPSPDGSYRLAEAWISREDFDRFFGATFLVVF